MKKIITKITVFVLVLSVLLLGGCAAKKDTQEATKTVKEKTTVKIAYLPLTHALPLFEEKKLLEQDSDIKIELVKFGSWPELLDALKSGSVDGASVLIELAMKAKSQGIGIKAVALGHKDGNAVIVSNDINTAADLKGKNFAIPHRLSSHNILLHELLEKNGLTENDIKIVEMAPPEMPAALASGQISGYCVAEPFGSKSVVLGKGKVLYQSADLWKDSLCCGLVLTDNFINKDKAVTDKFISNYIKAGNQLNAKEANRIAKEYLNQDEKTIDLSLQWISYQDLNFTENIYNDLVTKIHTYKLLDAVPTYTDFVYQNNK
jgi:ABC-type nitrate/sulfonate/bicarbonate transport systems, periplasmic components